MQKTRVGCYRGTGLGAQDEPEEVFFTLPDHGYELTLYSCVACGARFVSDAEAEHYANVKLPDRIANLRCPDCDEALSRTLKPYPQTFRASDGSLSQFEPPHCYPPDSDHTSISVWNLDTT